MGYVFGAELFGYDATNRHRYGLGGTYESQLQTWDGFAVYSNRSLGPALSLTTDILTTNLNTIGNLYAYSRQIDLIGTAAFPIIGTYSTWTPQVDFNVQKVTNYLTPDNSSNSTITGSSLVVPSVDGVLSFSNQETSSLAINSEDGRYSLVGSRYYFNGNDSTLKVIALDQEFIRLGKHSVLSPSVKGTWVSNTSTSFLNSQSVLQGRSLNQLLLPFPYDNFNQMAIRGYPGYAFISKLGMVAALDLQFPIARIFRGWGTNPFFLDNLYGIAFAETSFLPYFGSGLLLPSAGAGIRLSTELFQAPLIVSAEFHQGFNSSYGASDLFFQVLASPLSF